MENGSLKLKGRQFYCFELQISCLHFLTLQPLVFHIPKCLIEAVSFIIPVSTSLTLFSTVRHKTAILAPSKIIRGLNLIIAWIAYQVSKTSLLWSTGTEETTSYSHITKPSPNYLLWKAELQALTTSAWHEICVTPKFVIGWISFTE